jgi:ABC-type multidrug transport system ATPase subunit
MPPSIGSIKYSNQSEIIVEDTYQHLAIATPYLDLIEEFTLKEQLEFHFALKKTRNGLSIVDILEKMELSHAKDKAISNFSSGMKQRTKLAMAFYTAANMLFLDEPGTNLDDKAFDWYKTNLANLLGKQLVFIASNQPEEYPQNAVKIDIMGYK